METVIYEYIINPSASGPTFQLTIWDYAVPSGGSFLGSAVVGHVHQQTVSGFGSGFIPDCVTSSDPTWN